MPWPPLSWLFVIPLLIDSGGIPGLAFAIHWHYTHRE